MRCGDRGLTPVRHGTTRTRPGLGRAARPAPPIYSACLTALAEFVRSLPAPATVLQPTRASRPPINNDIAIKRLNILTDLRLVSLTTNMNLPLFLTIRNGSMPGEYKRCSLAG